MQLYREEWKDYSWKQGRHSRSEESQPARNICLILQQMQELQHITITYLLATLGDTTMVKSQSGMTKGHDPSRLVLAVHEP